MDIVLVTTSMPIVMSSFKQTDSCYFLEHSNKNIKNGGCADQGQFKNEAASLFWLIFLLVLIKNIMLLK